MELDGSGSMSATNTFGANGLISRRIASTGTSVFYTFDERGNTTQRLNSSGGVITSHISDAYGSTASSAATTDPYDGYGAQAGYYTDHETGLILCTFRYYDPATGRWLNRDPIGHAGGINLYGYCTNNPTNLMDPLGLLTFRSGVPDGGPGIAGYWMPYDPDVDTFAGVPRIPAYQPEWDGLGQLGDWCIANPLEAAAFAAGAIDGLGELGAADAAIEGSLTLEGAAAGAGREPALPLGRGELPDGTSSWGDMMGRLQDQGVPIRIYGNGQQTLDSMQPGTELHFNMNGFEPGNPGLFKRDGDWTRKEWRTILDNPELHPGTTVYNVPKGMEIPRGITIGPNF